MQKLPSLDLARVQIPGDVRSIREFTVAELKDELLRRGNVDFSKWEVLVKLSPVIVIFAAVFIYKLSLLWDGTILACLFQ